MRPSSPNARAAVHVHPARCIALDLLCLLVSCNGGILWRWMKKVTVSSNSYSVVRAYMIVDRMTITVSVSSHREMRLTSPWHSFHSCVRPTRMVSRRNHFGVQLAFRNTRCRLSSIRGRMGFDYCTTLFPYFLGAMRMSGGSLEKVYLWGYVIACALPKFRAAHPLLVANHLQHYMHNCATIGPHSTLVHVCSPQRIL